jgi:hypothetical protein
MTGAQSFTGTPTRVATRAAAGARHHPATGRTHVADPLRRTGQGDQVNLAVVLGQHQDGPPDHA